MAFRGSSFQNFPREDPLDLPHRSHPPPPQLLIRSCITNFSVQIIVFNGPLKPAHTNSGSQNFKNLGKDIPELPHLRVCPPPFLERIVALDVKS